MNARTMMIIRDVAYAVIIVLLMLPGDLNPFPGVSFLYKIAIAVVGVSVRIWQHVNYYKATGKIY